MTLRLRALGYRTSTGRSLHRLLGLPLSLRPTPSAFPRRGAALFTLNCEGLRFMSARPFELDGSSGGSSGRRRCIAARGSKPCADSLAFRHSNRSLRCEESLSAFRLTPIVPFISAALHSWSCLLCVLCVLTSVPSVLKSFPLFLAARHSSLATSSHPLLP
jgi:hypothetical protein